MLKNNKTNQVLLTDTEMAEAVWRYIEAQGPDMSEGMTFEGLQITPAPVKKGRVRYDWLVSELKD